MEPGIRGGDRGDGSSEFSVPPTSKRKRQDDAVEIKSAPSASSRLVSGSSRTVPAPLAEDDVARLQAAQERAMAAAAPAKPAVARTSKRETLDDIAQRVPFHLMREQFDVPLRDAAEALRVSVTTLKRLCRRYGVQRWPHRRLHCVNRAMDALREKLATFGEQRDNDLLRERLQKLERKREEIIENASRINSPTRDDGGNGGEDDWLEDESSRTPSPDRIASVVAAAAARAAAEAAQPLPPLPPYLTHHAQHHQLARNHAMLGMAVAAGAQQQQQLLQRQQHMRDFDAVAAAAAAAAAGWPSQSSWRDDAANSHAPVSPRSRDALLLGEKWEQQHQNNGYGGDAGPAGLLLAADAYGRQSGYGSIRGHPEQQQLYSAGYAAQQQHQVGYGSSASWALPPPHLPAEQQQQSYAPPPPPPHLPAEQQQQSYAPPPLPLHPQLQQGHHHHQQQQQQPQYHHMQAPPPPPPPPVSAAAGLYDDTGSGIGDDEAHHLAAVFSTDSSEGVPRGGPYGGIWA